MTSGGNLWRLYVFIRRFYQLRTLNLAVPIYHLAIPKALAALMGQALLIHSPPQIILLAVDLDENFINVEGVTVASVLSIGSINTPSFHNLLETTGRWQ
jgi:hypothetical protein